MMTVAYHDNGRRARQQLHTELFDGLCDCPDCRPVSLGDVIDEMFQARGISAHGWEEEGGGLEFALQAPEEIAH
jgi:hypothetical protein